MTLPPGRLPPSKRSDCYDLEVGRASVLFLLLASGCGPDDEVVSGHVRLGKGIDRDAYASLELRIVSSEHEARTGLRPEDPDALIGISEPLAGQTFPREFTIRAESIEGGYVIGWLAEEPDASWVEPEEPHGFSSFVLCECATHTPAYADDVSVEILHNDL